MEAIMDVKKCLKDYIRQELRPILYAQGFKLSKPTTYVRERDGLLQEFYFRVEVSRLRPWVSIRPIFEGRSHIVTFGTDYIHAWDVESPYRGFTWVTFDVTRKTIGMSEWEEEGLPRLDKLKSSIQNGVLPELNKLCSLDDFLQLYQENGLLFEKRIQNFHNTEIYYDFIKKVALSSGVERMQIIINVMQGPWLEVIPKEVRVFLESYMSQTFSDEEADKMFEEYCNTIRGINSLPMVKYRA